MVGKDYSHTNGCQFRARMDIILSTYHIVDRRVEQLAALGSGHLVQTPLSEYVDPAHDNTHDPLRDRL